MTDSATLKRLRRLAPAAALGMAVLGLALGLDTRLAAAAPERPRLVVLVVIDQFRYDYLERFDRHFGDGGFRRFAREGASFSNAMYRHATTDTCPGHAVIATGYWGNLNGIVANRWVDSERGREVDCAAAGRADRSLNLLRPTIGDAMKQAGDGDSKVVVASGKRAAAVILGGRAADVVLFPDTFGRFGGLQEDASVPGWVQAFNDARRVLSPVVQTWTRLLPDEAYEKQGPDEVPAEAPPEGMGRTFPHPLTAGLAGLDERVHEALGKSPFTDEILADLAMTGIREEQLGRDAAADLLAVSFSANDRVGHSFGPDSHEAMDTVVRIDRQLERLLNFVDQEIGLEQTLVILTADHGVAPLPEVARRSGHAAAGRVPETDLAEAVARSLTETYGVPLSGAWIAFHDFPNLYLDEETLRSEGVPVEDAEILARDTILGLPGIEAAYTRTRLRQLEAFEVLSPRVQMVLLSFRADRSGHVVYQLLPYNVADERGTNHGSHWEYDRHVPLLWLGGGVKAQTYERNVSPADVTPTIRAFLGLEPEPEAPGRVLHEILPAWTAVPARP